MSGMYFVFNLSGIPTYIVIERTPIVYLCNDTISFMGSRRRVTSSLRSSSQCVSRANPGGLAIVTAM